jgi:hypothetical protein
LVITRIARGRNKREANANAKAIQYNYEQQGNTLLFDKYFVVDAGVNFRKQDVKMVLRVPKGKVVRLDRSVEYLLYDVENTTNTWDGDMAGRRWRMTEKGLECIDCKDLIDVAGKKRNGKNDEDFVIDENGIRVSSDETEIKINKDGIHVHTPKKEAEAEIAPE